MTTCFELTLRLDITKVQRRYIDLEGRLRYPPGGDLTEGVPPRDPAPTPLASTATVRMSKASLMNGLRLIIALAMMAGILSFGSHSVSSHGPGMTLGVAGAHFDAVGDMGVDGDHGHDHDSDEEPYPAHVHGHNPVDHSHVTMSLAAAALVLACARSATWHGGPPWAVRGEPLYSLDRPPRSGVSM
jgi:hypothetical protein